MDILGLLSQRISAGSLFSSGGGFLGLSDEKKGPASYTITYLSFLAAIYSSWTRHTSCSLTAYELLYPLKPKSPI